MTTTAAPVLVCPAVEHRKAAITTGRSIVAARSRVAVVKAAARGIPQAGSITLTESASAATFLTDVASSDTSLTTTAAARTTSR